MISMQLKQFLRNSNKGFTLIEIMVANALGMLIVGLTIAAILSNRSLYQHDLVRTRVNQNLRGALDLVGVNIREAGENLPATVPAVEVIDGGADADELILRRNLIDEVLKLCTPLAGGSSTNQVYFSTAANEPGCTYGDQQQNFAAWLAHRTQNGGSVKAYIFDPTTNAGEIFDYVGETDSGLAHNIVRGSGNWQNDYSVGLTAVYLIEQWHFRLVDDVETDLKILQLIENDDLGNPKGVVFGLESFRVVANMQDDTVLNNLTVTDEWTNIKSIEVALRGQEMAQRKSVTRNLSARFFPRNILSN